MKPVEVNGIEVNTTRFIKWDLTQELKELELNYVPVKACNELMGLNIILTAEMMDRFILMDRVCNTGKLKDIEELEPLPIYHLLKYGGVVSDEVFSLCYSKLDDSFRDLLKEFKVYIPEVKKTPCEVMWYFSSKLHSNESDFWSCRKEFYRDFKYLHPDLGGDAESWMILIDRFNFKK